MALSLDDKLLAEKVDNYCSSSDEEEEDEDEDEEEERGGRRRGSKKLTHSIILFLCIYCRKPSTMALSLDDKLLGEKVDNYCSSSEDEDREDEDEGEEEGREGQRN